jgi:hypothetical protein
MSVSYKDRVFGLETELLLTLCENIGSPRALAVHLLASSAEWEQLLELKIRADDYDDHQSFSDDYLVTALLSKNQRVPLPTDKQKVAIDKFARAESVCADTNQRLSEYESGRISPPSDICRVIHHAREYIRRILGPLTRADLSFAESKMRFGPGATTSVSGVVTQGKKYSPRVLDTTPRLLDFGLFCLPPGWRKSVHGWNVVNASKLTTVPKNAKTDRVICIEPDLNIFVQLGIGALIREKLRLFGLDLNTQSKNQFMASVASHSGLCTLDLSSASDTISRSVVWHLLPERWVELLHLARVDNTVLPDGTVVALEKWSSMGNGYTFELESLIFYGILLGAAEVGGWGHGDVTAYGDDLILPLELERLVVGALTFLGFSVNVDKSFGKGRFHESCGTDWFDGHNVRPFFLRTDHHDFPTVCYVYANSLRRWAHRRNNGVSCDRRLLPAWLRCFTAVDPADRHRIPEGFGDVGFVENLDRAVPGFRSRRGPRVSGIRSDHPLGWATYEFSYRRVQAVERVISEEGCLTAFLNGNHTEFSHGRESLRGRFMRAATKMGHVLTWPNLGPWQ